MKTGQQSARPGACAYDQLIGIVSSLGRQHRDVIVTRLYTQDLFICLLYCSVADSGRKEGPYTFFRQENTGLCLEDSDRIGWRAEGGETSADSSGIEVFVRDVVQLSAKQSPFDHGRVFASEHQPAGLPEQGSPGHRFELFPQWIGGSDQRDVQGVFEIRLADDPALAM